MFRDGVMVFSPIAHTHPIAMHGELPTSFEFYAAYDEMMISRCDAVVILMLDGWRESVGVTAEIEIAKRLGKPIALIEPFAVTPGKPSGVDAAKG
jgi:nucleoside 2-deoxyribosyltransferase